MPSAEDDVVIGAPGAGAVAYSAGSTQVKSLRCAKGFDLTGGSLTLTAGASSVQGALRLLDGDLYVDGPGVSLTAGGTVEYGGTGLNVREGASLSLPGLARLAKTSNGGIDITASGVGTVVDLSTRPLGPYPVQLREVALRTGLNIVAGTGFYIQSVVDGIVPPEVKPNWKLRDELEKKSNEGLFNLLKEKDPRRAETIRYLPVASN